MNWPQVAFKALWRTVAERCRTPIGVGKRNYPRILIAQCDRYRYCFPGTGSRSFRVKQRPHVQGNPPGLLAYDACVLAAASWLLEVVQIPAILPPAPKNKAAEARATNAMSKVYSIRSCPSSSTTNFRKGFFMNRS